MNQGQPKSEWQRKLETFGPIAAILAAFFALSQTTIMRDQLDAMRDEQRPWLFGRPITVTGNLVHDDSGLQIQMSFNLQNIGHSPAQHTFISFTPSLSGGGPQVTAKVCSDAEKSMFKLTIFPGDSFTQSVGGKIPESEFAKYRDAMKNGNESLVKTILPTVTACIAYKDNSGKVFHHTPYTYYLALSDANSSPLPLMLNEKIIPADALSLVTMPMAGPAD
jgi:hypothetical protein